MIQDFNKEQYIKDMQPAVKKLVKQLNDKGIVVMFPTHDGPNKTRNVHFAQHFGNKSHDMSEHSFYRFSGLSQISEIPKEDGKFVKITKFTDDDWLQTRIKPIVELILL